VEHTWGSSALGQFFVAGALWKLTLAGEQFQLVVDGKRFEGSVSLLDKLSIHRGLIWAKVRLANQAGQVMTLGAISNAHATQMHASLRAAIDGQAHRLRVDEQIRQFSVELVIVGGWVESTLHAFNEHLRRRGWISLEAYAPQEARKPGAIQNLLEVPEIQRHLGGLSSEDQKAVAFWRKPLSEVVRALNKQHTDNELVRSRSFFNTVEKAALSDEQAHAVMCFENRVLLVASAGSGKTSTMVAKAGYALSKGYFSADKMLLLAFNADAAAELRERIQARLAPLGLPSRDITAKTFHAFGLDIIGAATGKKPSLAAWVESGRDQEALLSMVDELKDTDITFRTTWDLFRLVFGQDLPKFGKESEQPEAWDKDTQTKGFWTLNNEVVKSRGELIVANWLFYNGVKYRYEAPYEIDTADSAHRQYQPDFFLPDANAYLEHWALDEKGQPPAEFTGYKESMAWKKALHVQHGTKLLETTMADVWSGKAFENLAKELVALGITLAPNPDRPAPGRQPIENPRLVRTIRSFLTHVKGNRLTIDQLKARLNEGVAGQFRFRHLMFLAIFEHLWASWEKRLKVENCIDFDDMLSMAADHLEQGDWESPYELVMVDEFQDASQARARLVAALVRRPHRYLFAVGDDWQSINRFAGADLSVMTEFEKYFGRANTLRLETTFRCGQALCDVSSRFIQKNPRQLKKSVKAVHSSAAQPVRILAVPTEYQIREAVEARVAAIAAEKECSKTPVEIFLLGRYNHEREYMPRHFPRDKVSVKFITVHSSKGLEADHVILPRVTAETMGFPSRVADDPVMKIAMPGGDSYEFGEERRLFYVAMTRARKTVTLVTLARRESSFISELMKDFQIKVHNLDGSESASEVCPACLTGFMVPRRGRYGPFFGCSNLACKQTRNDPNAKRSRKSSSR
jgi:DNA helicase-4